jgi:hypothetical protein
VAPVNFSLETGVVLRLIMVEKPKILSNRSNEGARRYFMVILFRKVFVRFVKKISDMTVTYQLTEDEFDYRLFRRIKSQFARRTGSFKIKIEIEETETDETEAIMANPYLTEKIKEGIRSVENGNVISFTPEQFDELVKKHSVHTSGI